MSCSEVATVSTELGEDFANRLVVDGDKGRYVRCVPCQDRYPEEEVYEGLPCNHAYCVHCLYDLFQRSLKDEELFPPRCCRQENIFELERSVELFQLNKSFVPPDIADQYRGQRDRIQHS